ncbi:hypothetical protein IGI41_002054 [Enterococcus sp. DIV0876]
MTLAVLMFVGFVTLVFFGIILGKSIDKREEDFIGKD